MIGASNSTIKRTKRCCPEQIATVLSDLDAEITALEARHAKTQAIKQGMMQLLITGIHLTIKA